MSCQFALKCNADLYFTSQFITLGECNPCFLYLFFLFLHWMILRKSAKVSDWYAFISTDLGASALCLALDKVPGLNEQRKTLSNTRRRSWEEREKGKSRRSYLGEAFYFGDQPYGGEEVTEALGLNSLIPTRKGACSLCSWAHTVENMSFLEKIRYGHEAKWVSFLWMSVASRGPEISESPVGERCYEDWWVNMGFLRPYI